MLNVTVFRGTKHPITAEADAAGIAQLRADPAVSVIASRAKLFQADRFHVLFQFHDPIAAALELELPYDVMIEREGE